MNNEQIIQDMLKNIETTQQVILSRFLVFEDMLKDILKTKNATNEVEEVEKLPRLMKSSEQKTVEKLDDESNRGIYIEEYTEKSIVVRGDTKPHKEELKKLGCKYNSNLRNGAGWIASKTNIKKIEDYISSL